MTRIFIWHTDLTHGSLFAALRSLFLNTNNPNDTNIFYTRITQIARMLVRIGTLTWCLLNESDTNEINTDSTRGFVNTHCLRLVLKIESLYSFFQQSESKFSLYSIIEKTPNLHCCTFFMFKAQMQRYFF